MAHNDATQPISTQHTTTTSYIPVKRPQTKAQRPSPRPSHFPRYEDLHPLSLTGSLYAHCTGFDVLDSLPGQDNVVLGPPEDESEPVRQREEAFERFGVWPRTIAARHEHLHLHFGWLVLEFDSVAKEDRNGPLQFSAHISSHSRRTPHACTTPARIWSLHVKNSLFFWLFLPFPAQWELTLMMRRCNDSAPNPPEYTPAFRYNIHVHRSWDYDVGGFCPSIFENTFMHCDERVQIVAPIQYHLLRNSTVTFRVLLNDSFFSHAAVCIEPQDAFPKKVFFLTKQLPHAQNASHSTSGSPHRHMTFFHEQVTLQPFTHSPNEPCTVNILLFERHDKLMQNPFILATYKLVDKISPQASIEHELPSSHMQPSSSQSSNNLHLRNHEPIAQPSPSSTSPSRTTSDLIPRSNSENDPMEKLFDAYDSAHASSLSAANAAADSATANLPSSSPLPISPKLTQSTSKYAQLSRFWTNDLHLFQPKSRYLRAGERTRFKIRIANALKVLVAVGKRTYPIAQVPTLFQAIKGEDNRMELYESIIVFKDPPGGKTSVATLFYYKRPSSRTRKPKRVSIAQFFLQPKNDTNNQPLFRPSASNQARSPSPVKRSPHAAPVSSIPNKNQPIPHSSSPTSDVELQQRPLQPVQDRSVPIHRRQQKGNSMLPNLRPSSSYSRPQVVYSVDVSQSLPTKLASRVLKQLPFLSLSKQEDSVEYFKKRDAKKKEHLQQLSEYWEALKEKQEADALSDETIVNGHRTTNQLGNNVSFFESRNELAGILLKNPTLEQLLAKQSRLSKSIDYATAVRDNHTEPTLTYSTESKRFHRASGMKANKLSNGLRPLLYTAQVLSEDATEESTSTEHHTSLKNRPKEYAGSSKRISRLKKTEESLYHGGKGAQRTGMGSTSLQANTRKIDSRSSRTKRERELQSRRRRQHQESLQNGNNATVEDIVNRVREVIESQDIRSVAKKHDDEGVEVECSVQKSGKVRHSTRRGAKGQRRVRWKDGTSRVGAWGRGRKGRPGGSSGVKEEVNFVRALSPSPRKVREG